MTKLERLRQTRQRLESDRAYALRRNDLVTMIRIEQKLKVVNDDIKEAEQYEPIQLSEALKQYGQDVKDRVYKCLLECSLVADLLNDCSEVVKSELKKIGLDDFHFRADIEAMCKLSRNLAALVIIPNQPTLTDMMCDNAEYIDKCHDAANEHLKAKLNL